MQKKSLRVFQKTRGQQIYLLNRKDSSRSRLFAGRHRAYEASV
jgi:hypothetical protein